MSMQLRVVHTTTYDYDGKAVASYNQARLTPVTTPDQIVVHSRVEVSPKPWTYEYRDYFGTPVTAFEIVDPHESMTVSATSTVQTNRPPAPAPVTDAGRRWPTGRSPTAGPSSAPCPTSWRRPPDFAQRAKQVAADHELPGDAARDLCALVHDELEFVPGATPGRRPGLGRLAAARRVSARTWCTSSIGGLRSMGIPARYVSGYFHPDPEPVIGDARASARPTPGSSGGTRAGTASTSAPTRSPTTATSPSASAATTST